MYSITVHLVLTQFMKLSVTVYQKCFFKLSCSCEDIVQKARHFS